MTLSLANSTQVFIFIIFSSIYVCSILWIFGDAATRGTGWKGSILPLVFIVAGILALLMGYNLALLAWPIGYIAWFLLRPSETIELTD